MPYLKLMNTYEFWLPSFKLSAQMAPTMLLHVMCGFNFYDRFGHQAKDQKLHSIQIYGNEGNMRLIGYDWETNGVIMDTLKTNGEEQLLCTDKGGYEWREGAKVVGESMQSVLTQK